MKSGVQMREAGAREPILRLSQRQLAVLELVARGLTNDDIAAALDISPTTVRTHITAVLARLEVTNRTEAAAAYIAWSARPTCSATLIRRPTIAVLPFDPLDDDPRVRALTGALRHELSTLFARWSWFPLIAHSAAIRARSFERAAPELGLQLGASYLVGGALRVSPAAWRLDVHIDSAATGHRLWTERHEFADDRLFADQDAVCEAIVAAAYAVLIAHTRAGLRHVQRPCDLQAWELAHEGMRLHDARAPDTNAAARRCFESAIERDPDLVLAHYGLGLTHFDDVLNQWCDRSVARERLYECAERCLELAPHAAEGHFLFGRHFQALGDHSLAARALESAIRNNPCFAAAHALLAQMLQLTGRSDEALTRMRHAARLGPGSFVAGPATLHFARGEYVDALAEVERALVSNPRDPFARVVAAASAFWIGDSDRASEHARALRSVSPAFATRSFLSTFGALLEPIERIAAALKQLGVAS